MSKKLRENSSTAGADRSAAAAKGGTIKKSTVRKTSGSTKKAVTKSAKPAAKTATKSAKKAAAPVAATQRKTAAKAANDKTPPAAPGKIAAEGAKAPDFRLPRDGGKTVSLSDYAGQKLVIFFYPRADTPGCTREAIDFTRLSGEFAAAKTVVLGVSADPLKAQNAFRDKHKLTTPLLSDENHAMLESYGAWGEKSMYGKTFEGVIRTTVLIGKDGKIARIWRRVKVDGHADAVLEAARTI